MHEVGPISEIGVAGGVGALGGLQTGVTIDASCGPLSATACGAVGSVVVGSMADEYVACQLVRSSAKWSIEVGLEHVGPENYFYPREVKNIFL